MQPRWKAAFKNIVMLRKKKYNFFDYLPDELLCVILNELDYRTLTLYVSTSNPT
jgi:hypothetical protein